MLVTFGASGLRVSPPGKGRLETAPTYEVTVPSRAAAIAAFEAAPVTVTS
jgi:hypothetical protein